MKILSNSLGLQKELRGILNKVAQAAPKVSALKLPGLGGRHVDRFDARQVGLEQLMKTPMPRLPQPSEANLGLPREWLTKSVEELLHKVFENFFAALKNKGAEANAPSGTLVVGVSTQPPAGNNSNSTTVGGTGNSTTVGGTGNSTTVGGTGNSTTVGGTGSSTTVGSTGRTSLSPEVFALAAKSPSLAKDLQQLEKDGWSIQYGTPGAGSSADKSNKVIVIDPSLKTTAEQVQVLAHEVGHALYPGKPDYSSKEAYITSMLADEGAAAFYNLKVQREIKANGGGDIGVSGNAANQPRYNAIYERYLQDGNLEAAHKAMGDIFRYGERASVSGENYNDYFGKWYDNVYTPWRLNQGQ